MKRSDAFLPFRIELKAGEPISDQVVYAVEKAIISGLLRPGANFPSVRAIGQELRIHPNTAQKAVTVLINEGFLEVHPGIGTVVATTIPASGRSTEEIASEAERLVLEAKRMGMKLDALQRVLECQWNKLTNQ